MRTYRGNIDYVTRSTLQTVLIVAIVGSAIAEANVGDDYPRFPKGRCSVIPSSLVPAPQIHTLFSLRPKFAIRNSQFAISPYSPNPQSAIRNPQSRPEILALEGDISPIHDPAIIKEGATYYVFASNRFQGKLVPMFCSPDLRQWRFCGNVFDKVPDWALEEVPGARGIWAPDIAYVDGKYLLYYSVSTFGSNRSVIGLITNKTLDPDSPDYQWVDEGRVIGSAREDDWNAIDANVAVDANGNMWLAFGSFWGGIKMRRLDQRTGKLSSSDGRLYSLASRRPLEPPALEAPFIVRKGKYYYLFISFDFCCRGKDSTYKIMVGRSKKITGPYKDSSGRPMMEGGGTLLVEGTPAWPGAGHPAVLLNSSSDLLVFHAYSGSTGRPSLQVSTMIWKKGWPRAGALPEVAINKQPR